MWNDAVNGGSQRGIARPQDKVHLCPGAKASLSRRDHGHATPLSCGQSPSGVLATPRVLTLPLSREKKKDEAATHGALFAEPRWSSARFDADTASTGDSRGSRTNPAAQQRL